MGNLNSLAGENVYLLLFLACYDDVASASEHTLKVERDRDKQEIVNRFHAEGLTFLTVRIPQIAKAIDIALATGTALQISGFKTRRRSKLPQFMGWLISVLFDDNGIERCEASDGLSFAQSCAADWKVSSPSREAMTRALRYIRTLCYLFYKLQLPPTSKQIDETIKAFKETDSRLSYHGDDLGPCHKKILHTAKTLVEGVLGHVDPFSGLHPRHGPGAVATGEKREQKMNFKRFYPALNNCYPFEEYNCYNANHWDTVRETFLTYPEPEPTSKVVLVPKDSRGPRLICEEPLELQWIQQGLMTKMVKAIEAHGTLSCGNVNFRSQEVNRASALKGSLDQSLVTLDMKEASDRVSLQLVRDLFPEQWVRAITSTRSTRTSLPTGEEITLRKCSPMGSAVCFPIEAIVFWALSVSTILWHQIGNAKFRNIADIANSVKVYGDDIICRTEDHCAILATLPIFGLMFNKDKCCTAGFFRESCGCDAYKGVDVTPLRIKKVYDGRQMTDSYVSWVKYHNLALERGLDRLANALRAVIGASGRRTPYYNSKDSPCVSFVDPLKNATETNRRNGIRYRFNKRYCRLELLAFVAEPVLYKTGSDGYNEMLRFASSRPPERESDESHLRYRAGQSILDRIDEDWPLQVLEVGHYTARRQFVIKRRWVPC